MTKNWKWFGSPGHLIVSDQCRFHLCTQVGEYLISTVGEYVPSINKYKEEIIFEEIGFGRKYETYVFKAGKPCKSKDCKCGLPEADGDVIDSLPANDRKTANENHLKLCLKWDTQVMKP